MHKFSKADILQTSCRSATKFGMVRGIANGHLFPEFGELVGGPVIPCDDIAYSVSHSLVQLLLSYFILRMHFI